MADLGMNFDATQVEPNVGAPPPLPTDWYNVIITDSENKQTKDKNGAFLELTLKVLDGPYSGRQVWDRLNLWNQNEVAVEIARKTLSAICHATGVFQVSDSKALHGIPLMARVVEKDASGGYDAGNDVKGYAKIGEKESKNGQGIKLEPRNGGRPQGSAAAPAAPGNGPTFTPPWGGGASAAAPTPPQAPPAGWGSAPPAAPPAPPAQPTPPAPPAQAAPPAPPAQPAPPAESAAPTPPWGGGAPTTPPWATQ